MRVPSPIVASASTSAVGWMLAARERIVQSNRDVLAALFERGLGRLEHPQDAQPARSARQRRGSRLDTPEEVLALRAEGLDGGERHGQRLRAMGDGDAR